VQLPNVATTLPSSAAPIAHATIVSINGGGGSAASVEIASSPVKTIDGGVGKLPCGWLVPPGTKGASALADHAGGR